MEQIVPQEGGDGYPHQAQLLPCPCGHTHTSTITRTKKPAQSGVHRQPSLAQLGGKDEVAKNWVAVRLVWVTQGGGYLSWDLQAVCVCWGGGQHGKKGGAIVSWALASLVLEGQVPRPFRPASSFWRTVPRASRHCAILGS